MSSDDMEERLTPILGAIVVSFDHDIGAQVESYYPTSLKKYSKKIWWSRLPNYSLGDGIHKSDQDMIFFQIDDKKMDYSEPSSGLGQCEFAESSENFLPMKIYYCFTCDLTPEIKGAICRSCILTCHEGHETYEGPVAPAYCDCGSSGTCTNLDSDFQPKLPYSINADSENSVALSASKSTDIEEPNTEKKQEDLNVCDFYTSGPKFHAMDVYYCFTCHWTPENQSAVCSACIEHCHADHAVVKGARVAAYCDCGSDPNNACLMMDPPSPVSSSIARTPSQIAILENGTAGELEPSIFGCSYFHQILSDRVPETSQKVSPRSRTQNCLVLVSDHPCYGFLRDVLEHFAEEFFSVEGDFMDDNVIQQMFEHIINVKDESVNLRVLPAEDRMDLQWFVLKFGENFLKIFKALCAGCTVAVYALPIQDSCSATMMLGSLIENLCEDQNIADYVNIRPYIPLCEMDQHLDKVTGNKGYVFGHSAELYIHHPPKAIDIAADVSTGTLKLNPSCEKYLKLSSADRQFVGTVINEVHSGDKSHGWIEERLVAYIQSFLGFYIRTLQEQDSVYLADFNKDWADVFCYTLLFKQLLTEFLEKPNIHASPTAHPNHSITPREFVVNNAKQLFKNLKRNKGK